MTVAFCKDCGHNVKLPHYKHQKKYNVFADHPTFERIDKYNLSESQMNKLVETLKKYNYENITIEKPFEKN